MLFFKLILTCNFQNVPSALDFEVKYSNILRRCIIINLTFRVSGKKIILSKYYFPIKLTCEVKTSLGTPCTQNFR